MSRLSPSCIERSLVNQSWLSAHGTYVDVIVGVPRTGMSNGDAHAWLDTYEDFNHEKFVEIHRITSRKPGTDASEP
jgi:hypothetical protein